MVQTSMPSVGSLLSSVAIAKLLEAAGSLVLLAKSTWMAIARMSPAGRHQEDPWGVPQIHDDSYLWQYIVELNPSWEKQLSRWQLKRVTYHLAKIVGNAAKVDAFRKWPEPAPNAYLAQLQQRAQVLLSGDRLPTPDEPEVAGLKDENYSDTDDELGFSDYREDSSSGSDDDDEEQSYSSFGSFGQPWPPVSAQPQPWVSVPPYDSPFAQWTPRADEPVTASTTSAVTAWLVIKELASAGHIDEHAMLALQSMLRDGGETRREILRHIDEFNDHLIPEHVGDRLRDLAGL